MEMGHLRGRGALGRLVLMCCLGLPSSVVTAPRARCARPCSPRCTLSASESPPPSPLPPSRHQPVWLPALNLRGGGAKSEASTRERGNTKRAAHARNDSGRDDKSRGAAPGGVRKVQSRVKGAGGGERSTALKVQERRRHRELWFRMCARCKLCCKPRIRLPSLPSLTKLRPPRAKHTRRAFGPWGSSRPEGLRWYILLT